MKIKNVVAVLKKQSKDTCKNKTILIQFIMFPLLAVIMTNSVKMADMPKNFFVLLFAVMYVGMAPLSSMAAILSEEKEKNTLRLLRMSGVHAAEYFLGIGVHIFSFCMMGGLVFGITGRYDRTQLIQFLIVISLGILISMMIGAAIGSWSKSQMSATSVTVPVMMVFSFLPMLSLYNETIRTISAVTYSQQIYNLMAEAGDIVVTYKIAGVLSFNLAIVLSLFIAAYKTAQHH